jgi:hypothetical protein
MSGLTDRAASGPRQEVDFYAQAQRRWEDSMVPQIDRLREKIRERDPFAVAACAGARFEAGILGLRYWDESLTVTWPGLVIVRNDGTPCAVFDQAVILYYLLQADGSPMADAWIGFRDLPSGAFYNQAYQGYTGDLLARAFGPDPAGFDAAAQAIGGLALPGLSQHAYAFLPLPRIRLAAVLWSGDDEVAARASVLFDGAASHYMTTDGLALLGSGLTGRLLRNAPQRVARDRGSHFGEDRPAAR